jgi:hypothetical protein
VDLAEVLVDEVGRDIEALRLEAELPVDIDDPLQEEGPGRVLDLGLHLAQVVHRHHALHLLFPHARVDLLGKLRHALWVIEFENVLLRHGLALGLLVISETLLELFLDAASVVLGRFFVRGFGAVVLHMSRVYLGHLDVNHLQLLGRLNLADPLLRADGLAGNFLGTGAPAMNITENEILRKNLQLEFFCIFFVRLILVYRH